MTFLDGRKVVAPNTVVNVRKAIGSKKTNDKAIQAGGQENILSSDADIVIGGGCRGGGKGEPYSAPIITPFGIRRMGDLKVGSIITAVDGGMQKVIHIYELGIRDVYRLNFSDGTHVDCTSDHLWKIKRTNVIHKRRVINCTGQEDDWELWTMEMIMNYLDRQNRGEFKAKQPSHLLVPLCEPVKFTRSFPGWYKPKTDAYVVGMILGDGCITESALRGNKAGKFTSADDELVQVVRESGIKTCGCRKSDSERTYDYDLYDEKLRSDIFGLKLNGCNSYTKFIPNIYKYAPLETRWALVQGLMDTDGMADTRGHCSYSTISPRLAEDMAFVLRSLGAYVTISKNKAGYKKNGEYIECAEVYNLYIKIKDSERLFRLPRKKERCRAFNGGVSTPAKRIVSYEYVGTDKCRCIRVSNPTALYLTNDFTVTHNTWVLLNSVLYDIYNPNFRSIILRAGTDDLSDVVDVSFDIFRDFGEYNKSKDDMTWNYKNGGWLKFSFHAGSMESFRTRFQGKQFAYIGVDEVTHMAYEKFKYLITCNRNAFGIRNRFIGTCNPDPDSWVAKFIDWWIGEDGLPIRERDGKIRYCFMDGDTPDTIYWGDTREEVYQQCKDIIDSYWKPEYERYGSPQELFIKSVAFVEAKLSDNVALMSSDPTYLANLVNQSDEQRARDLDGNWKFKSAGDDMIKLANMEAFYKNTFQYGDNQLRATCDVAGDGGDNLVLVKWIGNHIDDIFVCRMGLISAANAVKSKLQYWQIREENFAYDLPGAGQTFKDAFPRAIPFIPKEAVDPKKKNIYGDTKSQCAYEFADALIRGEYSINPYLLKNKYSGNGYENVPLESILNLERKAIRQDRDKADSAWQIIKKKEMKRYTKHSPDFIEAILMRRIFDIKGKKHVKPKMMKYVNPMRYR